MKASDGFVDRHSDAARKLLAAVPERSSAAVGALTGRAHALTHPDVPERVQRVTAQAYSDGVAWLNEVAKPEELPMRPELLVRVVHALTDGLLFQKILTPVLVPDEVFHAAFALLARKRRRAQQD